MNKRIGNTLQYENEDLDLVPSFKLRGYRTIPRLYVNGSGVPDNLAVLARPGQTLLSFLRDVLHLTGSKLGCAEGGCGACTVMISRHDGERLNHYSVNACLMPVLAADNMHITTIEGLKKCSNDGSLHPIQQAMVDFHGSQCGFCTPGIIISIYSLFASKKTPPRWYIEEHLDGNLCRCTGYRPIWDAARVFCSDIDVEESNSSSVSCSVKDDRWCDTASCSSCFAPNENNFDACGNDHTSIVTSTSLDKFKDFISGFVHDGTKNTVNTFWRNYPETLFPKNLLTVSTPDGAKDSPLIVIDKYFCTSGSWFKPTAFVELLYLLKRFAGSCKLVVGNTEVGIETKFKRSVYPRLISPSHSISEVFGFTKTESHLVIGACLSLSSILEKCSELLSDNAAFRSVKAIHDMLRWFASSQIRNVASLGGNLVTASPIADMNPLLACMCSSITIASLGDDNVTINRRVVEVSDFFVGYRKVDLRSYEMIESITIPLSRSVFDYVFPFKQARRREDDISIVTSGMRLFVAPEGSRYKIVDVQLAFGGMAPKTVIARETADLLRGRLFCEEEFINARRHLQRELDLPDDVPGGQAQFRKTLASSFLHKLFIMTANAINEDVHKIKEGRAHELSLPDLSEVDLSAVSCQEDIALSYLVSKKPSMIGAQKYPCHIVHEGLEKQMTQRSDSYNGVSERLKNEVGETAPHLSAVLHCTGDAVYVDDMPLPHDCIHASLILATTCNVPLISVDASKALQTPGVVAVYFHQDIIALNGDNKLGPIMHDEYVFLPLGEIVAFIGQVIGICVGATLEAAELGARSVDVTFGNQNSEPIVSIHDAICKGSFYPSSRHVLETTAAYAIKLEDELVTIEGSFSSGGQEHFYLETNAALAIPGESSTTLTVYSSTQNPTETQKHCALATNLPASNVVVRVKRMGGGFGGKETRSVFVACAAAVAAKLSGRPTKLTLGRDVDMMITGGRHAFMSKYRASAFKTSTGRLKLNALEVELFSNGGSAFDLSGPVMDRALFHVDGPYRWNAFKAVGVVCKTVQPPHTAFRGFGGPQGMAVAEHVIDHFSMVCGIPGEVIRHDNFYIDGDSTPFGMVIGDGSSGKWNIPRMWDKLCGELEFDSRREAIKVFNSQHKLVKRGMALTPTKFGIAFTAKFMNQAGALVHVYTDGTVLVTHGGTEMGQGLHTKVCQIVAQAFGIPLSDVFINETATDKVANSIPTAASMSTDLYGMAALDACKQILERLEPLRKELGVEASLSNLARTAFFNRINLSALGFFALDGSRCGYDWNAERPQGQSLANMPENAWKGQPFNYFTQGVAYSEVEIDVLTGNHRTLRSDVLVDVGASINPALDIGQIEGAFIQGMGWSTLEEVIYGDADHCWIRPRGKIFTTGPGTYKIPAFNDVPEKFNVSLMDKVDNPFAVHSSKAVGEPPFFLGCSVFYAIKDAVRAARQQNGYTGYFEFRMPSTSERIRMACNDPISLECGVTHTFQPKGSY